MVAIPVDTPPPLVGRMPEALWDMLGLFRRMKQRHGPRLWSRVGLLNVLTLMDADDIAQVLRNEGDVFSNRDGWALFLDHVFPGALLSMDGDEHRLQRRIMQQAFTNAAIRDYVTRMTPTLQAGVAALATRPRVARVYPAMKSLTLDVACTTFMSLRPGREATLLRNAFVDLVDASITPLRVDVRPTLFARAKRSRRALEAFFRQRLDERRRQPVGDLLGYLAEATTEDGERFDDQAIIDQMIFLMMAAHDTSTSTLTTVVACLAEHPEWQERLRSISLELPEALDADVLQRLDLHSAVIREALRLRPPLPVMARGVRTDTTIGGAPVPAGSLISLATLWVHHDPALWTDPERFDPERFLAPREEHRRHRSSWMPFGGGAHQCIGQRFGTLEITLALHLLLRAVRWRPLPGLRHPWVQAPIVKPIGGLPVWIEPLR
jgi:cytochrome P450